MSSSKLDRTAFKAQFSILDNNGNIIHFGEEMND